MPRILTTPRQARDRLSVSLATATEVFRAAQTTLKDKLPDEVIAHVMPARSHLKAAIAALNHRNSPGQ